MEFVAENGHKITARDETQASAFKNAGLKPVEEKPKKDKAPKEDPPTE
jgi:hypothetical protein